MEIIRDTLLLDEVKRMAEATFGDLVKAVVDVEREVIAVDGELHSDLEALLLEDGSRQENVWGINFYPEMRGDDFIEFDSVINIRPSQGNRSRGIENEETRRKVIEITAKRIAR